MLYTRFLLNATALGFLSHNKPTSISLPADRCSHFSPAILAHVLARASLSMKSFRLKIQPWGSVCQGFASKLCRTNNGVMTFSSERLFHYSLPPYSPFLGTSGNFCVEYEWDAVDQRAPVAHVEFCRAHPRQDIHTRTCASYAYDSRENARAPLMVHSDSGYY